MNKILPVILVILLFIEGGILSANIPKSQHIQKVLLGPKKNFLASLAERMSGNIRNDDTFESYKSTIASRVAVDNNGNLTHFTHDYVYNWKNQLVKVITGSGVNVEYKYDALGRRIVKKVKDPNSETVTRYVHDGYQVIEERNGSDQVTYRYTYGNGIDERIQIERREKNQDGNYEWRSYFPIHDSIGNVTALTNDTGHLIERYNYSPYGEVTYFNTESAPGIDYVRIKDGVIRIKFDRPVDPGKIYIHLYIKSTQQVIAGDKEYIDIEEIGYRTSTLPINEMLTLNLKNQSGPGEPIDIFSQDFTYQSQADVIVHDGGKPYVKKEVQVENNIVIIFNEEIDPDTTTYEVELEKNNIKIDGTLVRTGANEYKFIPSGGLVKDAQYMLRMSGFKDLLGNAMDDLEHSFVSTYNNTLIFEASILTANNHSVVGNTSLMHGRTYEPEVGLYYFRNRYYHPQLGRFLQQDPNGYEDSLNMYQAFNLNPVNFTDPFGSIIKKGDLYELRRINKSQGPDAAKRWIDRNPNFSSGEKLDLHMKVIFGFEDPDEELKKISYIPVWTEFWAFIDETAYQMSKPYLKFHAGVKHRRYDIAAEGLGEIAVYRGTGGFLGHYIPEGVTALCEKFPILNKNISSLVKEGAKDVRHAVQSPGAAQSVIDGINPKYFNPDTRFGRAFYVAEEGGTAVAEVTSHGSNVSNVIRFKINLRNQKVLDLTKSSIATKWGYNPNLSYKQTQKIAEKALKEGFKIIAFPSTQGSGTNYAILSNFEKILKALMVTSVGK